MKLIHGPLGVASLGTLALTLFVAGCGGGSPGFGGMAASPNLTPVAPEMAPGGPQEDMNRSCKLVQSSQNFNGHVIQIGRWIWFSSTFKAMGAFNDEILVRDSVITFADNRRAFRINAPDSRIYIHGYRHARLGYNGYGRTWVELAPDRHKGQFFADGVAFNVPHYIPRDVKNVTWSARFYASRPYKLSWKWGAAVYSQFSNKPRQINVKPTRFYQNNADPAGTPLNFTSYLVPGGTGSGGKEYTGGMGKAMEIRPCR